MRAPRTPAGWVHLGATLAAALLVAAVLALSIAQAITLST
jgi:hypothetical protein